MRPVGSTGSSAADVGRVSGPARLESDIGTVHVYKMPYRRCVKRSGLTYPIAVCPVCHTVVEPSRAKLSKTGAHGTMYFVHPHPLEFIILEESNSGKRRVVTTQGIPRNLETGVGNAWILHDTSPEEIKDMVKTLLEMIPR